jgi:hypothetical protein
MKFVKKAIRKMADQRTIGQLTAEWKETLRPQLAELESQLVAHDQKRLELLAQRNAVEGRIIVVRGRIEGLRQAQAIADERVRQLAQLDVEIPKIEQRRQEARGLGLSESVETLTRDLKAAKGKREQLAAVV